MSQAPPAGARCRQHPDVDAAWLCHRCGSFFCEACARRTRPEAAPLCPACWDLRAQTVAPIQAYSRTRLQTAGLVLGCVAIFPIPALQVAALITNIIALVKAKDSEEALAARWKCVVGLSLTGVGLLIDLAALAAVVASR